MTQPLRKAHARIWVALAVALVMLFVTALMVRPGVPVNPELNWEAMR
jgi:hypothetical protein